MPGSVREFGQSLTATASGWLVEIGLYPTSRGADSVESGLRIIEGDGFAGATLTGPQTVVWDNLVPYDPDVA